jgi:hypothetical protein
LSLPHAARLIPEDAPEELADIIASFISPHMSRLDAASDVVAEPPSNTMIEDPGTTEGGMA